QRLNFPVLKKPALMNSILHALNPQTMTPLMTLSRTLNETATVMIVCQNQHLTKQHHSSLLRGQRVFYNTLTVTLKT
ncbi:hypothetical protein M9458_008361, partial [Cirrhinus mrigala]